MQLNHSTYLLLQLFLPKPSRLLHKSSLKPVKPDMPFHLLLTTASAPPPSHHSSLLTIRSSSSKDPLIPLYVVLGIVAGVFALLIITIALLLCGCCCCCQVRKAYQTRVGSRQHVTYNNHTHHHEYWHSQSSDRPSRTHSTNRSRERTRSPGAARYIQAVPPEFYSIAGRSYTTRTPDRTTPRRLALTFPSPSHISDLQRSKSYTSQTRAPEKYDSRSSPLSRRASAPQNPPGHFPHSDIYASQWQSELHNNQSRSPSPSLSSNSSASSRSTQRHKRRQDYRDFKPRSVLWYESQGRPSSREERFVSRSEQLPSLSSDGRPSLIG